MVGERPNWRLLQPIFLLRLLCHRTFRHCAKPSRSALQPMWYRLCKFSEFDASPINTMKSTPSNSQSNIDAGSVNENRRLESTLQTSQSSRHNERKSPLNRRDCCNKGRSVRHQSGERRQWKQKLDPHIDLGPIIHQSRWRNIWKAIIGSADARAAPCAHVATSGDIAIRLSSAILTNQHQFCIGWYPVITRSRFHL